MTADELRDLGKQIARDVAEGLMQATAAGARAFSREMADAARAADTDNLLALAERVEAEKATLAEQIGMASGLKRLALQKRLATLEQAEQQMCREITEQTPALPAPVDVETSPRKVSVRLTKRQTVANGHGE